MPHHFFISEITIHDYKNNETIFMDLPQKMHTERRKNVFYPLIHSTKIRSKRLIFKKLRKYLTNGLHLIFNGIKNK